MKKFFMMMAMVIGLAVSANADAFDNTYVTLKGGATALMHPGCNGYENLGHTFEAATGLEFGKWITPHWGLSIDGTNGWTNGSKFGVFQDEYAVNYLTAAALLKYRLPIKKVDLNFAAGPEWIHGFKKNAKDANDLGAKFKIEVNWNLSEHFALQFAPELNYNMRHADWLPTKTGNQPYFDSRRAWYGVMVGVTYKIGNGFTKSPYKYTQADMDRMNAEINELRARQPETITNTVTETKYVTKEVPANVNYVVVLFDKNSSVLDATAKKALDNIAGEVSVMGSASPEGQAKRNEVLARERAEVVTQYLIGRGVKVKSTSSSVAGSRVVVVVK